MSSRYVQRCTGPCKRALGISSFRVLEEGGRSSTCRWCEEVTGCRRRQLGTYRRQLGALAQRERRLERELGAVRSHITTISGHERGLARELARDGLLEMLRPSAKTARSA